VGIQIKTTKGGKEDIWAKKIKPVALGITTILGKGKEGGDLVKECTSALLDKGKRGKSRGKRESVSARMF